MSTMQNLKDPMKRAHFVGTSAVVTIDPTHVRRLKIDELTFFVQKSIPNGILLEVYRLDTKRKETKETC
jgi:hypothetical protein